MCLKTSRMRCSKDEEIEIMRFWAKFFASSTGSRYLGEMKTIVPMMKTRLAIKAIFLKCWTVTFNIIPNLSKSCLKQNENILQQHILQFICNFEVQRLISKITIINLHCINWKYGFKINRKYFSQKIRSILLLEL